MQNGHLGSHVREFHLVEPTETFGLAFLRELAAVPGLVNLAGISTISQPHVREGDFPPSFSLHRPTFNSRGSSFTLPIECFLGSSLRRVNLSDFGRSPGSLVADEPKLSSDALPNLVDLQITFKSFRLGQAVIVLSLIEHCAPRSQTLHLRVTASTGNIFIGRLDIAQLCTRLRVLSCNMYAFVPTPQQPAESSRSGGSSRSTSFYLATRHSMLRCCRTRHAIGHMPSSCALRRGSAWLATMMVGDRRGAKADASRRRRPAQSRLARCGRGPACSADQRLTLACP